MKNFFRYIYVMMLLAACSLAHAQESAPEAAEGKAHARARRQTVVLGSPVNADTTRSGRSLKRYTIAPKGEWQLGMSIAYMDLSTDNSDFMLVLDGNKAAASIFRLAPNIAVTYHDNQSIGLRFMYTDANCAVDATTLDLLGNFSFEAGDIHAGTRSYGGHVYHRSYIGLDNRGRVGLFVDASLGYTRSKTTAYLGDPSGSYTLNHKFSVNFCPGVTYFPMNNVSCSLALSLADISYNRSLGYSGGEVTGTRNFFRAQCRLNLLALNFGLAIHL